MREDIIAPILRKAGYRATGVLRMERSKSLVHPFVMIGSKKHKINIIPDYTLYEHAIPLMVLEAKAPGESVVKSRHVEQAYSYAIHPDVRCAHYALCNGRQLAIYHISESAPLFVIECKEIRARWHDVEKYLLAAYLKLPELRKFQSDFGMLAQQMGILHHEEMLFAGMLLQHLCKSSDSLLVANCSWTVGGIECLITFDFGSDVLDKILTALPQSQAAQIRMALTTMPYSIDLDAKVRVHWTARLGDIIQGQHEQFIPMVVADVIRIEFDASLTVGKWDPAAELAGVKRLRA